MKKCKLILLQVLVSILLISTSVYAASANIGGTISKSTVKKGETVTATLSLVDVGENEKIGTIEGYINYNTSIFETITVENIQKDSDGNVKIGSETLKVEDVTDGKNITDTSACVVFNAKPSGNNNTKILIDLANGISSDTELLKINFKVKSNVSDGQIQNAISFSNFVLFSTSVEEGRIAEDLSKNINLTITSDSSTPVTPDDPTEPDNTNTPTKPDDQQTGNDNKNENVNNNDNDNKNENVNNNNNNNRNENTNTNRNENTNTNENTNRNTNENTNTNTNTNKNNNTNNNNSNTNGGPVKNEGNGEASKSLPKTGAQMVMIPMIILIIVAYISYNRYIKYKDI